MKTLKPLIKFIYLGKAEVEQDELTTFLKVARELEIKGLQDEDDPKNDAHGSDDNVEETSPSTLEEVSELSETKVKVASDVPAAEKQVDAIQQMQVEFDATFKSESDELLSPEKKVFHNASSARVRNFSGEFECAKCEFKTNSKQSLKVHEDSIHNGVRYPCEHCEYKATQKSSLNRHVKNRHSTL